MALNFLGLGFSFGAKDTGLGSFLDGIDAQFQQITETLKGLYNVAEQAPQMGGAAAAMAATPDGGAGGALSAAADAAAGLADVGKAGEAAEGISKAAEAASGASDVMSRLGSSGKMGGKMLSSGAFKAIGAFGRVAGAAGIVGMAIGPVVAGLGEAVNAVTRFGESVAMALPNAVRRGMAGIQRMNQGINLTNSLEAEAQGLSVSARALGANMGYTGRDLDRFTRRAASMASALNMGADATANAIRAWDEAGDELRALGFESARDVARFTEAFGVNADTLRNTSMQMTREFGLTTEQVHELVSSQVAMGQASGDVAGALNQLPQIMTHMRSQAAMMGEELNGAELAHHARSAAALATGFFQLGQDSDQARESALSLAGAMLESRREFQNMFAGTQDDLPGFAQQIAIATGDVQSAFDMMQQGPDEFMRGMAQLVQQTRANGGDVGRLMEFMRARFGEAVGPEQADQMVNFFRRATPEILRTMAATEGATRNLGQMGREAHRTGRTLQESFDRALEGAQTALRGITRRETAQFVRDTGREMRRLGQAFRDIGEQEGAMGGIVRLMSRTAQMGQLGLVPERFRTTAVMANQIHENMQPLINSMTSFGGLVDSVATQAILFGTRVAQNMSRAREEIGETADESAVLRRAFDITANEFADEWVSTIERVGPMIASAIEQFANIDWENLFTPSEDAEEGMASGAMGAVQRVIRALGQIDWGGMWENLQRGFGRLWQAIRPYVVQTWNEFKTYIVGEVNTAFGEYIAELRRWWNANWYDILGIMAVAVTAIGAALTAALVIGIIAGIVLIPMIIGGVIGAALGYLTARYIMPWLEGLWRDLTEWWEGVQQWFGQKWDELGRWWQDSVTTPIQEAWDGVWNRARQTFDRVYNFFRQKFLAIQQMFQRVRSTAMSVFNGLREFFQFHVDFVYNLFTGNWTAIREQMTSVVSGIRTFLEPFFEWMRGAWAGVSEPIQALWNTVTTSVEGAFNRILEALRPVRDAIQQVGRFFTDTWNNVGTVIGNVVDRVSGFFRDLGRAGINNLTEIMRVVRSLFEHSMNTVIGGDVDRSSREFQRLQDAGEGALNAIFGTSEQIFGNSMHSVLEDGFGADVRAVAEVAMDPNIASRRDALRTEGGGILEATHYPDWYMNDFRTLYDTRATEMIRAIRETSTHQETTRDRRRPRARGLGGATGQARGLPQPAASPAGTRA